MQHFQKKIRFDRSLSFDLILILKCKVWCFPLPSFLHCISRAQDVPPEVLRQREVKWLDMLNHWDKWMMKRFDKVSTKSSLN